MLKLFEMMTRELFTVMPETSLREAVELMSRKHISGLPVLSANRVVGLVSSADILAFAASTAEPTKERPDEIEWAEDRSERENTAPSSYFTDLWMDTDSDVADRIAAAEPTEWGVLDAHTVDEVMTREIVALSPNDSIRAAADLMRRRVIHRVMVIDHGELVGIVSALDVARAVAAGALTARD